MPLSNCDCNFYTKLAQPGVISGSVATPTSGTFYACYKPFSSELTPGEQVYIIAHSCLDCFNSGAVVNSPDPFVVACATWNGTRFNWGSGDVIQSQGSFLPGENVVIEHIIPPDFLNSFCGDLQAAIDALGDIVHNSAADPTGTTTGPGGEPFWLNNATGVLWVFDTNSNQWVDTCCGSGGFFHSTSDPTTTPPDPTNQYVHYNTQTCQAFMWVPDLTSSMGSWSPMLVPLIEEVTAPPTTLPVKGEPQFAYDVNTRIWYGAHFNSTFTTGNWNALGGITFGTAPSPPGATLTPFYYDTVNCNLYGLGNVGGSTLWLNLSNEQVTVVSGSAGPPTAAPTGCDPLIYHAGVSGVTYIYDGSGWVPIGVSNTNYPWPTIVNNSPPSGAPSASGSPWVFDNQTGLLYLWNGSTWVKINDYLTVQNVDPTTAPAAYNPKIWYNQNDRENTLWIFDPLSGIWKPVISPEVHWATVDPNPGQAPTTGPYRFRRWWYNETTQNMWFWSNDANGGAGDWTSLGAGAAGTCTGPFTQATQIPSWVATGATWVASGSGTQTFPWTPLPSLTSPACVTDVSATVDAGGLVIQTNNSGGASSDVDVRFYARLLVNGVTAASASTQSIPYDTNLSVSREILGPQLSLSATAVPSGATMVVEVEVDFSVANGVQVFPSLYAKSASATVTNTPQTL